MSMMDYEGKQKGFKVIPIATQEIKKHIGKRCVYLREQDLDKSGRGYIFPRYAIIHSIKGRNILLGDGGYSVTIKELREFAVWDGGSQQ